MSLVLENIIVFAFSPRNLFCLDWILQNVKHLHLISKVSLTDMDSMQSL
jgi:hypothetical protein